MLEPSTHTLATELFVNHTELRATTSPYLPSFIFTTATAPYWGFRETEHPRK